MVAGVDFRRLGNRRFLVSFDEGAFIVVFQ